MSDHEQTPRVRAFLEALRDLQAEHGLQIVHEDTQEEFIIEELGNDGGNAIEYASDHTKEGIAAHALRRHVRFVNRMESNGLRYGGDGMQTMFLTGDDEL